MIGEKIKEAAERTLLQTAAALTTELPENLTEFKKIQITFENRGAHILLETRDGITVEKQMMESRMYDKVEEEARKLQPDNPQEAVNEELAPLNRYETESQDSNPEPESSSDSGKGGGTDLHHTDIVKDKI